MPPNQHTPEEIRDMEHWQRQSIASDYEVTPNLSKEELKTQLIDAVEHPPNPDVVEYSPEEIREMEYHEWQSIAPEYDVHPNLSPGELEKRLIDAITDSESETDDAEPGHDNDNARNDQSTTPIEDTEQAALTNWGRKTIDYPEFDPAERDDDTDARVELTKQDWIDSPVNDENDLVNESDASAGGNGNGAKRLAEAIMRSGTARTGSDHCPNCTHQQDNTLFYDSTHAACLECRTIYPLDDIGLTVASDLDLLA